MHGKNQLPPAFISHATDSRSFILRHSGALLSLLIVGFLSACGGGGGGDGQADAVGFSCGGTPPPVQASSSSNIIQPPTAGLYAYNTFMPNTGGFPAVGGTFTDPNFLKVIRRLTDTVGSQNQDDIYAHHWANADGTFAFTKGSPGTDIIRVATGVKVYTNQPDGLNHSENYWDALDPDKYYYFSGANLMRRNLATGTDTVMKTFPSTLQLNGGSLNIQTCNGRFFTVRYSGTNKVWDSQLDIIYTGSVTPLDANGWVSITPDGKYMVTAAGSSPSPGIEHYSYPINHNTRSIGGTATQFWGLCGDHGVLVSASDGKNYFITFDCAGSTAVYRVDISLNQAGRSASDQRMDNQLLLPLGINDEGHFSAVSRGPLRNWVFMSSETNSDTVNGGVGGWTAYEQEILAINVLTLEVRRLAHHRSRGLLNNYEGQPRVSSSWDGSVVMWASNFNNNSPVGYADLYAIQSPLQ